MVSYISKVLLLVFLSDGITNVATDKYKLHIYTADKWLASTDARVYVKFFGESGNLPETHIDPDGDSFERARHDIIILSADASLGELSSIEVKRDSRGLLPDWGLDRMEVDDLQTNVKYIFNYGKEISRAHHWYKINVRKPFSCIDKGYQLVNGKCEYLETCRQGETCRVTNAICAKIYGQYNCHCKPGYIYKFKERKCKDVDECVLGAANCHHKCFNTAGSFKCGCRRGFTLQDKYHCQDIDECQDDKLNICESPANCINLAGSYSCECPDGYEKKDQFSCKNTNECQKNPNICNYETSVKCIDLNPGYKCECKPGFYNERNNLCTKVRTCVPLGAPTGATFVQSRCTQENANYFKDVCTLKCLPGYEATNPANTELKCGADSLWEGTVLRCKPFECPPIRVLDNGIIRPQSCNSRVGVKHGETCHFFCDNGYKRNGARNIKCMKNRQWSDSPPTCDKGFGK